MKITKTLLAFGRFASILMALLVSAHLCSAQDAVSGGGGEVGGVYEDVAVEDAGEVEGPTVMINDAVVTNEFGGHIGEIGAGRFARSRFKVSSELRLGYDTNSNTSAFNPDKSGYTGLDVSLGRIFGGRRTQVLTFLQGGFNWFWDSNQKDDTDFHFDLRINGMHQVNPRLSLAAVAYLTYQVEPEFGTLSRNRRQGPFWYTNNILTGSYQITPSFSSVTSYSFVGIKYEDAGPSAIEDRIENYISQEFRYLFLPTTTGLLEYRLGIVTFDTNPRDSISHFVIGGVQHQFSPKALATLRLGAEFRDYKDGGNRTSPYAQGLLRYRYMPDSNVHFTLRLGQEQSDLVGIGAENMTLRLGLGVDHAFTGKLSGRLQAYYQYSDHKDHFPWGSFNENLFSITAGLSYEVRRSVALALGYTFTQITGDVSAREYDRNRIWGSVKVSF